jgi:hypothetical protein
MRASYCAHLRAYALVVASAALVLISVAGAHPDPWGVSVVSCDAHNGWCIP